MYYPNGTRFTLQLIYAMKSAFFFPLLEWNINIYIIRSQEKNVNLNRDSNLGPPEEVQVQIFLLRSDNVNFPRHKLCLFSLNNLN